MQKNLSITKNSITIEHIFTEEEKTFFIKGVEGDSFKFQTSPKTEEEAENLKYLPLCHRLEELGMLHETFGLSNAKFDITEAGKSLYEEWKIGANLDS